MNLFVGILLFIFVYLVVRNWCKDNNYKSHIISRIMRGSARWSLASKQDSSPLVAVLHANYGCAYLWALKDVFNDYEIKSATGIDVIEFQNKITDIQDTATKRMVKLCPAYACGIEDKILSNIAGES
jgi:hypothetical protein